MLEATLSLQRDRRASLLPPQPIAWCDKERANGALEVADEAAPFSGGGAVLVRGFVQADAAAPPSSTLARLVVWGDSPLIDKSIACVRPGRTPLEWEQALRTHENPVGTPFPTLVDPQDPTRSAGLGPVSASWAPRVHLLSAPIRSQQQILELPELDP